MAHLKGSSNTCHWRHGQKSYQLVCCCRLPHQERPRQTSTVRSMSTPNHPDSRCALPHAAVKTQTPVSRPVASRRRRKDGVARARSRLITIIPCTAMRPAPQKAPGAEGSPIHQSDVRSAQADCERVSATAPGGRRQRDRHFETPRHSLLNERDSSPAD